MMTDDDIILFIYCSVMMEAGYHFTLGHQSSTTQAHPLQPRNTPTVLQENRGFKNRNNDETTSGSELLSKLPGAPVAMPWSLWGRRADPPGPPAGPPPAAANSSGAASSGAASSEPSFEEPNMGQGNHPKNG